MAFCFNKSVKFKLVNKILFTRKGSKAWAKTREFIDHEIEDIQKSGIFKKERVITSKQGSWINIEGKNEKVLNFCSNNYLGLSVRKLLFLNCLNIFITSLNLDSSSSCTSWH